MNDIYLRHAKHRRRRKIRTQAIQIACGVIVMLVLATIIILELPNAIDKQIKYDNARMEESIR